MNRGDVIIVDFRPHDPQGKVRPALVVQNDRDNSRMANTIVVMLTSVIRRSAELPQLLIDKSRPDWIASGLHVESVVNCSNIFTMKQQHIIHHIGQLSESTMRQIDACLKAALDIA
jgi:mRNA-degrading endonuclease toxin of MazEF toxin-antitoxin module